MENINTRTLEFIIISQALFEQTVFHYLLTSLQIIKFYVNRVMTYEVDIILCYDSGNESPAEE